MSPRRRNGSKRPIRTRNVVVARHWAILQLFKDGFEPTVIAEAIGLKHTATAYRHIDAKCRCVV